MTGDSDAAGNGSTDVAGRPTGDAIDRFERVVDMQADLLSDIDNKAEHVTRLVGLLLGVVLTALLVGVTYLALAVFQYVVLPANGWKWASFVVGSILLLGTVWYVLTGRYLTLETQPQPMSTDADEQRLVEMDGVKRDEKGRLRFRTIEQSKSGDADDDE